MEHLPEIGLAFGAFALGMFSPGRDRVGAGHLHGIFAMGFHDRDWLNGIDYRLCFSTDGY